MPHIRFFGALAAICAAGMCWSPATAAEYFDAYGLLPASAALDLGAQPLGYPSGVISSVMQRDRILSAALAAAGAPMKVHPFKRGADMVALLGEHKLEAGLIGDMPTILAASTGKVWVVGLVKQTSTAIVAASGSQVQDLAGKRIAYVPISSAHHTLLQGLSAGRMDEKNVKLVPMDINAMPDALARGEIDAFAAWEPATSIALSRSTKNRIVFRGRSSDYFVVTREFEQRAPEAARLLIAGYVRAIEWMRRSQKNAEQGASWARADAQSFTGTVPAATVQQVASVTRRDILNVPSAPAIANVPGTLPLKPEFEFLRSLGKLPAQADWSNVATSFTYRGLTEVLSDPRKYELRSFDYQP